MDTSALLAVLFREDEAPRFEALIAASSCRMSAANVLEAALVVEGRGGRQAGDALDGLEGCARTLDEASTGQHRVLHLKS